MEPLTLQVMEKLSRYGRVQWQSLVELTGFAEFELKDAIEDANARGWIAAHPNADGTTSYALTVLGGESIGLPPPLEHMVSGPLGDAACPTCKTRNGLGTCSTCIIRMMRGGGVDGLRDWLRMASAYLQADQGSRSRMEHKRLLLIAWLAGWDVPVMTTPAPHQSELVPLPRMRYLQGDLGPPTPDAEDRLTFDLEQTEHARQMAALLELANQATAQDVDALEDLANVGLVLCGVNLKRVQRTFRLSALGRIIAARVIAGR